MRALQRDTEIIPEPWDQWTLDHLEWLTTPRPDGDGYELIEDYVPPAEPEQDTEPEPIPEASEEEPDTEPEPVREETPAEIIEETPEPEPEAPQEAPEGAQQDDVVIIDGVEYRRAGA